MGKDIESIELKVLVLEDSIRDMELISEMLSDAGYNLDLTHVEDEFGFTSALKKSDYDIILSDFKLPGFDAFGALEISRKICPEVPFICVSGSIGEETAIELLKLGAVDYVLKDRPERLPFAVKRALDEAKKKTAHLKSIQDLQESEHRFRQVAETAHEWIWEVDKNGLYTYVSSVVETLIGFSPEEMVGRNYFYDSFIPEKKEELKNAAFEIFSRKETFRNFENQNIHKNGNIVILSTSGSPILDKDGNLTGYRGVDEDITEQRRAEKALSESEKKFRKLFQNHAAVKLIIDPENGKIVEANLAAIEFYGWSLNELQKMNISQINTLPQEVLQKEIEKALKKKKVQFEFKHRKVDGSIVDVEVFSSSIKIGGKLFLHSIIHDISERKKAEEKIKLLNRAIESSSISVVITDRVGTIEYVNPFSENATGYSFNELIGKNPRILKSGNQPNEFYEDLWNTILSGKNWEGEFHNKRKNGQLYWEKAVISPIVNSEGVVTNFVAIKEDITERKRILKELVAAKEKAEESEKLKSAFLANMSHEIRTPMNGILGFAELLKEPDLSGEQQKYFISIIEKSGARMLNIINDIVDISKIEAGQMRVEKKETNINEQLEYIYNFFKPEVEAKAINFSLHCALPVGEAYLITDREKVYAILTNLVKNAIKYTDTGSIEMGYLLKTEPASDNTRAGYQLEFYVKDTGIGIEKDRQEAIFERFIQADITDIMARQGAGLGLSIAKAYVEMLGGNIRVESEMGKGSVFYFTIPFSNYNGKQSNIDIENRNNENGFQQNNLKAIIADDDKFSAKLLSIELSKFCNEIIFAETGAAAVEAFGKNPDTDLIFMDIQMPEMNGYEATRQIRQFNTDVFIIAVTAFALAGDREIALDNGCNEYISKPIIKDELKTMIQKYLHKRITKPSISKMENDLR